MDETEIVFEDDVERALEGQLAWCPTCADFTTPGAEPHDQSLRCADCQDGRACGVRHAVDAGFIQVAN